MNMFKAMIVHIIGYALLYEHVQGYDCPHNKHSYMNMFKAMIVHIISTLI